MEDNMTESESTSFSAEITKPMPELALVTATFYPEWYPGDVQEAISSDKLRGDLALRALDAATQSGFTIGLVDGGSSEAFLNELSSKGINYENQRERGGQGPARQGLSP